MLIRVKDGTNAGVKSKPLPDRSPWVHVCAGRPLSGGVTLEAAYKRCPDCGTRKP